MKATGGWTAGGRMGGVSAFNYCEEKGSLPAECLRSRVHIYNIKRGQ